ncbi:MAG: hypothetical protein R3F49_02380 [Planctomycetota bacterium]
MGPDAQTSARVHVGRALAPAKVNPTLVVLGRRADGYHEVDTTLVALELCDELLVRIDRGALGPGPGEAAPVTVRLSGPEASADIPRDARNLAVRALVAARDALAPRLPWLWQARIELELLKRIPSQAGLGGGSSDAAAAVRAFERAVGDSLAPSARATLLAELGADCAFFGALGAAQAERGVAGSPGRSPVGPIGAGRARGFGERVEALTAPSDWHFAVLTPEARCPTGLVYGALRFPLPAPPPQDPAAVLGLAPELACSALFNHLEGAALSAVPELRPWRALFDGLGRERPALGGARLSGSGSSWFALAASHAEATELVALATARAEAAGLRWRGAWAVGCWRGD